MPAQPERPPNIRCEQLQLGYRDRTLCQPFDVELRPGEIWAVLGRNGAGKSTWIRTLAGLVPPIAGRVVRVRQDLGVAYLPQRATTDDLVPLRGREFVALGLLGGASFWGPRLQTADPRVTEALRFCGATELADRPVRGLSEGQRQRIQLARLAVTGARVLLLDEPTSAMDAVAERETLEILHRLRAHSGATIVLVLHFLDAVEGLADRVMFFPGPGAAPVIGPASDVLRDERFKRAYSHG